MFDIHTSILTDGDEGEVDYELMGDYINAVMNEFSESPEYQEFCDSVPESEGSGFYAGLWMDYAANYFGATLATISAYDAAAILFNIFPRKVSMEPQEAASAIAEIRALWRYLKRTRDLPQADEILERVTEDRVRELEEKLEDSSNFGMAKSLFMQAKEAGFDMTDEEEAQRFIALYNSQLKAAAPKSGRSTSRRNVPEEPRPERFGVAPIHKEKTRVGRNDPCPCGSGRKYKKCCGGD